MLGQYYYHQIIRKTVIAFGTLFNDIHVRNQDATGKDISDIKVPISYGPKQKFLARLDQETGFDAPMEIKLPRMAFEMTSLTIDTAQKMPKRNKIV